MNKTTKQALSIFVLMLLFVCMLAPAHAALPIPRDPRRNMQRDVTATSASNGENLIPMPEGNITEGETEDGIIGDDEVVTTTSPKTTTKAPETTTVPKTTATPTTTAPTTTNPATTTAPTTDGVANNRSFVIWGVVLALIIAAAVLSVVLMTKDRKR